MLFISFIQISFLLNAYLVKDTKIDLTFAAVISLETAGLIGNKYTYFYSFAYMFVIIFFSFLLLA